MQAKDLTDQQAPAVMQEKRRSDSVWSRLLFLASIPVLILFLYGLLGQFFFIAELVGNFRLLFFYALLPLVGAAFWFRWKIWIWVLLAATIWSSVGTLTPFLPSWQTSPGNRTFRLMSFNVLTTNKEVESVMDLIAAKDPDVLLVVEYANHWHPEMMKLDKEYPYSIKQPRWHGFGIALFSKFPLEEKSITILTRKEMDSPMLSAKIRLSESEAVNILGIHTISPTSPKRLELRNSQLAEAALFARELSGPTIVAGDFNCTPWSQALARFLKTTGFRDSRSGFGYHASFRSDSWFIRIPIDHAFASSDVHIHRRFIGQACGSDHFPVIVDFSISE